MNDSTDTYLAFGAVIFMIFIFLLCLSCNISNVFYDNDYVEID
jgi:hypothetical protein